MKPIEYNFLQFAKAFVPSLVKPLPITTQRNSSHEEKAKCPIDLVLFGMLISCRPVALKASFSIEVTPSGILTSFKFPHLKNAESPIVFTDAGILTAAKRVDS